MADDQDSSKEIGDDVYVDDSNNEFDVVDQTTTATISTHTESTSVPYSDEYPDDEVLPDVIVHLKIDEDPKDLELPTDLVTAGLTDSFGHEISSTTPLTDSIKDYTAAITQGIYDQINENAGAKRWWGSWSWQKILLVSLIALCILGVLLGLICLICGKKIKKNRGASPQGTVATQKAISTAGATTSSKHHKVANV